MKLTASDKLALIREYRNQGGTGSYLNFIRKYEEGGEVSTSVPYEAPNPWKQTIPKQKEPYKLDLSYNNPMQQDNTNIRLYTPKEDLIYPGGTLKGVTIKPTEEKYRNTLLERKEDIVKVPITDANMRQYPLSVQKDYFNNKVAERPDYEGLETFVNMVPGLVGPLPFVDGIVSTAAKPLLKYAKNIDVKNFVSTGSLRYLNPNRYKPNSEYAYRMIGEKGYIDAVESGIIRSKNTKAYPEPYFAKGKVPDGDYSNPNSGGYNPQTGKKYKSTGYGTGYMIESKAKMKGVGSFKDTADPLIVTPDESLSLSNPNYKIYKQHFWKGYKEINVPKQNFKSEIDWAKWNKEIPENKALLQEYHSIEQQAKANGTWMKNPDGTNFPGTPEQFIQQNSNNFKKAFGNTKVLVNGRPQILTHNSPDKFTEFSLDKITHGRISGDGIYTYEEGKMWDGMPEHIKKNLRYPAKIDQPKYGNIEYNLYGNSTKPRLGKGQFDDITKNSTEINYTSTKITDDINGKNVHLFPNVNQLKSAIGNNGMFDMTNPNIYKALFPFGVVGGINILNK